MKLTQNKKYPDRVDLWDLPNIVNVEVKPARYNPPKQFWVDQKILEVREGLEILVQLSAPLLPRAKTPALYIGDTPITYYETAGENLYRFIAINPSALQANAPIAMGWPQLPKTQLLASNFRFQMRKTDQA